MGRIPKSEKIRALSDIRNSSASAQDPNSNTITLSQAENQIENDRSPLKSVQNQDSIIQYSYLKQINTNVIRNKRLNSDFNLTNVIEMSQHLYWINSFDLRNSVNRAHDIRRLGTQPYMGHDVALDDVWSALVHTTSSLVKNMIFYVKDLPGFVNYSKNDFTELMRKKLFDFYMVVLFLLTYKLNTHSDLILT